MKGTFDVFKLPVGKKKQVGEATLSSYEYKDAENPLYNLRQTYNRHHAFMVADGKYNRLHINGELVMSDTRMEKMSNEEIVDKANGNVLLVGLGIGLVIHNLMDKLNSGIVTKITVVEKSRDVIELISPYYRHKQIEFICADIFNYEPKEKFDTIYFDIWAGISTDNLPEIKTLHNKFKSKLNRKNLSCYMNSWMKEYLQKRQRNERRSSYY